MNAIGWTGCALIWISIAIQYFTPLRHERIRDLGLIPLFAGTAMLICSVLAKQGIL